MTAFADAEVAPTKHTILLADDDQGLRRLLGTTLGSDDFNLLYAADGQEAVDQARLHLPEVMLLDVNMPRLNGFEVCRILKGDAATREIKIVMISARTTPADRQHGQEAGADEYFVKPFSPVQLLNKIYSLFE